MATASSQEHRMPSDNDARIAAVKSLGILDTASEAAFDDIVTLASAVCGTPISLVTFLDGKRQWFKAKLGLEVSETPQEHAFCAHAIMQPEMFIVPDALADSRFNDNPLVTSDPSIRFYAGMPLKSPDGHPLGTLCVIDTVPRILTPEQKNALAVLSRQVEAQIKARFQMKHLNDKLIEKTLLHAEISGSNALFQAFMDNSPLVGYLKDEHGRMIYYNRLFAERFNISRDEWLGKDDFEIWPPDFAAAFREVDLSVLEDGKLLVTDESSPSPGGATMYWRSYKFPLVDDSGLRYVAGLSLDISAEREAEIELKQSHDELHLANERLRELSVTDQLTGLYNRRGFDERIQQEINVATRYGFDFSILLIDVDNFKSLNDTFGHDEGDEVLRTVANLLQKTARASDVVCRYGGEEFAFLLPNTNLQAAILFGNRVRRSVETARWKKRAITISIGASTSSPDWSDTATMVRRADLALYEAKALGKNRVAPYRPELEPLPTLV